MFRLSKYPFLLVCLLWWLLPFSLHAAEVDSHSLWRASVALSAEKLLLGQHQEMVVEQELIIASPRSSVMAVLSDMGNYPGLYPLFDEMEIHKIYQSSRLEIFTEFTALDRQSYGRFVAEHPYFGIAVVNDGAGRLALNIWQFDQVFIRMEMQVEARGCNTHLMVETHIQAAEPELEALLTDELEQPLLRIDQLKLLLERGYLTPQQDCSSRAAEKRYCF